MAAGKGRTGGGARRPTGQELKGKAPLFKQQGAATRQRPVLGSKGTKGTQRSAAAEGGRARG